ncbi:MAG: hypothetical protein JW739_05785 [Opitutales bacterium]|nr:hypothetical protein [Opitutales bacterium]
MNKAQRSKYFKQLWPNACRVQQWDPKDTTKRHLITRQCMLLCGGPDTDSITKIGQAEISALFTYLNWLASPQNLRLQAAWESCMEDYRTRNVTAQGNYWRRRAGYAKAGKIERDRFSAAPYSGPSGESELTPEEAENYLLTMRSRAKTKKKKGSKYDMFKEDPEMDDNCPF